MGLLYQFPVEEDPADDRIIINNNEQSLTLKSYGLPMLFWGYLAAILIVIFFMYLAIRTPIEKLISTEDSLNVVIGLGVLTLLFCVPIVLIGFFFYEKVLYKKGDRLKITHKVFWVPLGRKNLTLDTDKGLSLDHFIDSPNIAAQNKEASMAGFQNRGYFQLFAKSSDGKITLVDRNSRKGEMKKMLELLNQF